jgi:uncharacterized protein (TIGR02594 family)
MPTLVEVWDSRLGIAEIAGKKHNPIILGWCREVGWESIVDDETAWCATSMCSAAKEAGLPMPPHNQRPLARSWLTMGKGVSVAEADVGDVVVWPRGNSSWQGHVNMIREIKRAKGKVQVRCIGGNQSHESGGAVTLTGWQDLKGAIGVRRLVPATVPALREAGSTEIKQADRIQNSGTAVTFIPMMWAAVQTAWNQMFGPVDVPKFASLPESLSWWQALLEGARALLGLVAEHPWLAGTLVMGLLCVLVGRQLKANRVAKHAAGVPLSVEVAKLAEAT